jgi:hypothetical protein
MKNEIKSEDSMIIAMGHTHNKISFDPVIEAVPILDRSEAIGASCSINKRELEALTSWTYFEPLQYR